MTVSNVIRRMLEHGGVSVTRYPPPNTLAWQVKQVLARLPISTVVDVGAHHGEFARMLRSDVGYRGAIVSFEPYPASFVLLEKAMANDPLWTGRQLALGSDSGNLRLNVFTAADFNSIRSPSELGVDRFRIQSSGYVAVPVARLDSLSLEGGPMLLKTDTQGYDLEVLAGAEGVMDRVAAIVIELSVGQVYTNSPSWIDAITLLHGLHFKPAGLIPLSREADHLGVIEFDGVFVRSKPQPLIAARESKPETDDHVPLHLH